jgi:hypothetical protein
MTRDRLSPRGMDAGWEDWRIAGALAVGLAFLYLATRVGVRNQCVDRLHYAFRMRSAPTADLFQGAR